MISSDGLLRLIEATDYRSFLKTALSLQQARGAKVTYASLARKAGLSSRSFPRDVILGSKRLTQASAILFSSALNLKGDIRSYFLTLVQLEEPGERPPGVSDEDLRKRLFKLRNRIEMKARNPERKLSGRFYEYEGWLEVYAALGKHQRGATLKEIASRTSYSSVFCQELLSQMLSQGVITLEEQSGRYRAPTTHPFFTGLGNNEFFKKWYGEQLSLARKTADQQFEADDKLFLGSVFSISSESAAELKQELRELLFRFVDRAENADGDRISKFVVAFF